MPDPSICFLIPYFGKWPFWFPFFLESCRYNPSIQWIFYTDCGIPETVPGNVTFIETTFENYCKKISGSLEINFRPGSAYKLCDIKPAIGLIHQDDLSEYDFWAYGDIDLVYGDIRRYFSASRLAKHDIFSTHSRRISGHLCLVRNNEKMRNAFKSVRNWKNLLSNKEHVTFDESAFSRLFVRHKNWPIWLARLAKPLNPWTRAIEHIEAFSTPNRKVAWTDGSYDFPTVWYWNKGSLTNDKDGSREFPYFHFLGWKKQKWEATSPAGSQDAASLAATGCWQITADGFFKSP
ncbi:MAG: hypothetical protein LBV49_00600 [Azonexus sp.]|jgi:hypothetical protein|nr:hypothetical protein [Azonexus sp.]